MIGESVAETNRKMKEVVSFSVSVSGDGKRMVMMRLFLMSGVLVMLCAGCGKPSVAATEAKERNSALFRKAREMEQTGDVKGAIAQYRALLIEEPRAFSAHFQLATLLQDVEEDYVGALYHYQQYLLLQPESDKAPLAQNRIRISEQLLAPQILRKVGDSIEGLTQAHLLKENDRLNRLIVQIEGEKSVLTEQQERTEKARATAADELERLRGILQRMRITETVEKPAAPLPKKSDFEVKPVERPDPKTMQTLRDEVAALTAGNTRAAEPAPAPKTAEEILKNVQQKVTGDPTPKAPDTVVKATNTVAKAPDTAVKATNTVAKVPDTVAKATNTVVKAPDTVAKATNTTAAVAEPTAAAVLSDLIRGGEAVAKTKDKPPTEAEPRMYVVLPGDTLFRIAEKFYGDSTQWKKIRDANKTNIDPDGRVRAGQILIIP